MRNATESALMSSAAPTLDDVLRATSGIGARLERIEDRLGALEKQQPRPVPSGASPHNGRWEPRQKARASSAAILAYSWR